MIKLHYAEGTDLKKPIELIFLKDTQELIKFMRSLSYKDDGETVYLLTSDYSEEDYHTKEIFIESEVLTLEFIINSLEYSECNIHLQEYGSFEDAYKVALDMREGDPLCYKKA
jgi:hypothetical protein